MGCRRISTHGAENGRAVAEIGYETELFGFLMHEQLDNAECFYGAGGCTVKACWEQDISPNLTPLSSIKDALSC